MTLEQFTATRRWSDNLGDATQDAILAGRPGWSYLDVLYIESAIDLEGATGEALLTIGREQTFGDLPTLERTLHTWAMAEGYGDAA